MPDSQTPTPKNLLETSIINNTKDIREIRGEVAKVKDQITDMRVKHQETESTLRQLNSTTGDVKSTVETLDTKLDQVNDTIKDNQIKGLEEYKNLIWKIVSGVLGAAAIVYFGFK